MHTIINYNEMLLLQGAVPILFHFISLFCGFVVILFAALYKSWKYFQRASNHTLVRTHRVAPCAQDVYGCPVIERSGLKGSLSTYTLTESQSIVYGGGVDRGQRRKRRVREKDRKSNGCFRVQPKSREFCDLQRRLRSFRTIWAFCVRAC